MKYTINVQKRDIDESVKKLKRMGKIPGVIYGHNEKTRHIMVDDVEFRKLLSELTSESTIITVKYGKESFDCVIKEIQKDILTDRINHIDFYHLHKGEKVTITVPVVLEGDAKGVKEGGVLDFVTREIEVECLPKDIISEVKVDISDVGIGDTIHVRDLPLDTRKYRILEDPSEPIISIIMPKAAIAEEAIEEVEEPEIVGEEKPEEEETQE